MTINRSEPFGTTPLPTPLSFFQQQQQPGLLHVYWDGDKAVNATSRKSAQQPQTQQIVVFESSPNEDILNGAVIDVNPHFVVYAVKNGLIRVLHRHSTLRALLRGHMGQRVTDIRFYQDGEVLATAASVYTGKSGSSSAAAPTKPGVKKTTTPASAPAAHSTVVIWRVFERAGEIMSEKLLEISTNALTLTRILWHPCNANQFWMMHADVASPAGSAAATLVETTRITTVDHASGSHPLVSFYSDTVITQGAVQLTNNFALQAAVNDSNYGPLASMTDLAWSGRDTRHVLTVHSNDSNSSEGQIVLWDLKHLIPNPATSGSTVTPVRLVTIREPAPAALSRCLFLPHDDVVTVQNNNSNSNNNNAPLTTCFVTASENNSAFTLWSPFRQDGSQPTKLQVVVLEQSSPLTNRPRSYILDVIFGNAPTDASPLSCFILTADRAVGKLCAFHCRGVWNDATDVNKPARTKALLLAGSDYVVPFETKFPIYSWAVMCAPTADIAEEGLANVTEDEDDDDAVPQRVGAGLIFDMKLFSYQRSVVQCLTLTSYMCLPPEHTWMDPTPGVRVERKALPTSSGIANASTAGNVQQTLPPQLIDEAIIMGAPPPPQAPTNNMHASHLISNGVSGAAAMEYDEDYDVDEEEGEEQFEAPDPASLPPPEGLGGPPGFLPPGVGIPVGNGTNYISNNPFANWLGAIASKTSSASVVPTAPIEPSHYHELSALTPMQPPGGGPPASSLPPPPTSPPVLTSTSRNVPPPQPEAVTTMPSTVMQPAAASGKREPSPQTFLSPMDFLTGKTAPMPPTMPANKQAPQIETPVAPSKKTESVGKGKKASAGKGGKNVTKPASGPTLPEGKISILKRDDAPLPVTAASAKIETQAAAAPTSSAAVVPPPQPPPPVVVATPNPDDIRRAVRDEIRASIVPMIKQAIQESLNVSVINPIQASIQQLASQGVTVDNAKIASALSESVNEHLQAAFTESVKNVLIPTLESVTGQVYAQIADQLEKGSLAANETNLEKEAKAGKELDAISKQLAVITALVGGLTAEIQSLKMSMASTQQAPIVASAPPALPVVDKIEAIRREILRHLRESNYETAFNMAVSASTAELVVFCCANADPDKVFGGSRCELSQPILLCLMQQLGTVLTLPDDANILLVLAWLQEIGLSLNPADERIQVHVPNVLTGLVHGITQKINENNPALRRPLQKLLHIIRGMQ